MKTTFAVCSVEGCERVVTCRSWCNMHYQRWVRHGDPEVQSPRHGDLLNKLSNKFLVGDECWEWTAGKAKGYGYFQWQGRQQQAHRVMYEHMVGPIPAGLDLDHLCRNRACIRPDHLEPVTRRENLVRSPLTFRGQAAKTHCKRGGHPLEGDNLYLQPDGRRVCRTCRREAGARYRARRAAA